jgi:hypothetical protein
MEPWDGFCSILALDNWLVVGVIPGLKLGLQLRLNHLQVPEVVVPRVVTVHTDNVHIGCLGREYSRRWGSSPGALRPVGLFWQRR